VFINDSSFELGLSLAVYLLAVCCQLSKNISR